MRSPIWRETVIGFEGYLRNDARRAGIESDAARECWQWRRSILALASAQDAQAGGPEREEAERTGGGHGTGKDAGA